MVTDAQLSKSIHAEGIVLVEPLEDASNETYLALVGDISVVYKPVSGEQPLWDFPPHTLSSREVLAYEIACLLRWDLVPPTVWTVRGPLGPGSVQLFVNEAEIRDVSIFKPGELPDKWIKVLEGFLDDEPVVVAHAQDSNLLKLAVFDAIINNADRKAGHILRDQNNIIRAIDHGVCFHPQNKLRTVLWGWAGQELPQHLRDDLVRLKAELDGFEWPLHESERAALISRVDDVLSDGLPHPSPHWPAVPWPVF